MFVHETTLHGKCPFNPTWDYYTLKVTTEDFIQTEEIEELCDFVRGKSMSQEDMAKELRAIFPHYCNLELSGRHGSNCKTTVMMSKF